jgi:hypothetical protein
MYIYSTLGHLFKPHVNKGNYASMNGAEVKPVTTRHINTGKQHDAEMHMEYKHRQQHWQSGHGKYIRLYNTKPNEVILIFFNQHNTLYFVHVH